MQLKTQKKATQEMPVQGKTVQKNPIRCKTLLELTLKDNFLFAAGLNESTADFGDAFVAKLQQSVKAIKADREIGGRYMLFEELLQNEHKDGFAEGKTEGLAEGEAKGLAKGRQEMLSQVEQICEDFPEEIR
ncbi:MAG: hypothetical protein NC243_14170 [Lachnoclostridium sp.]|nr:hypothetical protein [Lachnoclostridium sp.]MCM1385671.1 hypothetical protein [Lachnoclostridium sp.]